MPRSQPPSVDLSELERQELTSIVSKHSTPQQLALRAKIILLADTGFNNRQIATQLGINRKMTRLWRGRWLERTDREVPVAHRLQDAPRPGAPQKFTPEQLTHLFAIACEEPSKSSRPITHWTAGELADEMQKRGIVQRISPRHVRRLLADAELKPHQIRYWLTPPADDPFF
jgi:putative transposase